MANSRPTDTPPHGVLAGHRPAAKPPVATPSVVEIRRAQGLPDKIEDAATLTILARILSRAALLQPGHHVNDEGTLKAAA